MRRPTLRFPQLLEFCGAAFRSASTSKCGYPNYGGAFPELQGQLHSVADVSAWVVVSERMLSFRLAVRPISNRHAARTIGYR